MCLRFIGAFCGMVTYRLFGLGFFRSLGLNADFVFVDGCICALECCWL